MERRIAIQIGSITFSILALELTLIRRIHRGSLLPRGVSHVLGDGGARTCAFAGLKRSFCRM